MPAPGEEPLRVLMGSGGAGVTILEVGTKPPPQRAGLVSIGVHRSGPAPREGLEPFDILLTVDSDAPRPWVALRDPVGAAMSLGEQVHANPVAAAAAAQVLRTSERLSFDEALAQESIAYSMLLASAEFRAWRAANPPRERPRDASDRVVIETTDTAIAIRLNRPAARNAFDAAMRD